MFGFDELKPKENIFRVDPKKGRMSKTRTVKDYTLPTYKTMTEEPVTEEETTDESPPKKKIMRLKCELEEEFADYNL